LVVHANLLPSPTEEPRAKLQRNLQAFVVHQQHADISANIATAFKKAERAERQK